MRLAFDHIIRRILRRALLTLGIAVFTVVAIYYFTVAGTIALDTQYGELSARLIVGAIYATLAIACAIWWAASGWRASASAPVLSDQHAQQIAMLVEAVMLGYALARKGSRVT
jgi:type VI protein secretion system component VasK